MAQQDAQGERLKEKCGWKASDDPNADLRLISSDNYVFWVSSETLAQHSAVFKAMLVLCETPSYPATLRLTDTDFETESAVDIVLSAIRRPDKRDNTIADAVAEGCTLNADAVAFAKKYEMDWVLTAIKIFLYDHAIQYDDPWGGEYVMVAASLNEWVLCGRLLANLQETSDDEDEVEMRRMMDWRGWTPDIVKELNSIGPNFTWAVCQAGTKCATSNGQGRIDYKAMGKELAKLMTTGRDPDREREICGNPTRWY